MHVTYFFRKPQPHYHSIERVFNLIIKNLPSFVNPRICRLRGGEKGILSRIAAMAEVYKNKGKINHITGDISYVALALPGKRLVITFHDLESLHRSSPFKSRLLKWFWVTLPARRAKAITVISEHTRKMVIEWAGVSEKKIFVIQNPLPAGFVFNKKDKLSDKPLLLVIGTKYNKNVEGIIDAASGLNVKLIIAGRLSEAQKDLLFKKGIDYENLIGASDQQIVDAYNRCDLLCFPSFFEGFGMPIIEAQAVGRPVITSNIGAMKEIAGDGALFVDPYNTNEIRNAITRLIEDEGLRLKLIENGVKNASEFNAEKLALKYVDVYNFIESNRC